jgi:hypothetical protein
MNLIAQTLGCATPSRESASPRARSAAGFGKVSHGDL